MSIGEDLVYDQSNDELVGFTDILVIKRSIYDNYIYIFRQYYVSFYGYEIISLITIPICRVSV